MIKTELVWIIDARNPHLNHPDVDNIVNAVLDDITHALAAGDRVELRCSGTFLVRHRPSRSGRNTHAGESVFVEDKWVSFLETGKDLRERLNLGVDDLKDDD